MKRKPFPQEVSPEERQQILFYLEERFGIKKEVFEAYQFFKGATHYWLFPKTEKLFLLKKLSPESVGLLFLRKIKDYLKPTSTFLQRFGKYATKNIVQLNENQLKSLQENKKIPIELSISPGYVILRDENWILGCGLYLNGYLFSYLETKVMKTLTD
jgi:hypothetical protein